MTAPARSGPPRRRVVAVAVPAVVVVALAATVVVVGHAGRHRGAVSLPLREAGRIPLPGDTCDGNAALLTLDLRTWTVTGRDTVGPDPDVLAYDPGPRRLYVAAESGQVTVLDLHDRHLSVAGRAHLADGAHVVAVDPATHRSSYPLARGPAGRPELLAEDPA